MGESAVCLEVPADGEMDVECSSRTESKQDRELLTDNVESDSFPNGKHAKEEALNDDIKSEVSNPVVSPKEFTSSFQDITSQETKLVTESCNQVLSTTSTGNLSSEETLSDGDERTESSYAETSRTDNNSGDVSKSHVVLEIPKHVSSSSGIRKITFKFSKRKEDYVAPLAYEEGRNYTLYDDLGSSGANDGVLCARNMEIKMSKKVVPNEYPTNVKKLLSTGILDGACVKYISTSRERQLDGIVNGGGYLCGCPLCNFSKVVSAHEFEQHAGAKTRHPNNHIYLENGKPIYSIIQELKTAPLGILEEVVKKVAGSSFNEGSFRVWKASHHLRKGLVEHDEKHNMKLPSLPHSIISCSSLALEESISPTSCSFVQDTGREQTYMKEMLEERKRGVKRPFMHQKRTAEGGTKKRDNDLHRLLFLPNGLPDGERLTYIVKGQRLRFGCKQGNGIVCDCCNKEISPSQFEAHAGMAARRQPYRHIYTSNGMTLHDIAISLAMGQRRTTGGSDDMCHVCGDGENLLLCNGCPLAFHAERKEHFNNLASSYVSYLPSWFHYHEIFPEFCFFNKSACSVCLAACLDPLLIPESGWRCPNCRQGHSSSMSRSVDLKGGLEAPGAEVGGCVICRSHDFSAATFDDRTVIYCDQCEKEFHVGCLRKNGLCDLKECFDPIIAECGRDLIPVMVYGRNISGQEFGGMYSVILTVKSVVVSAGLLRIFGREVAELPLVATCREYQGKGCFQALFSCIERLLCSLNVENLVLPAAEKAESIWTKKFGFRKMSRERVRASS
ncbi:PHD-type domain-containing protein [Citrus sinensis]|uniref:PHD-type domain-containing protein n=1 Tax=Citrus sinensis TaxID=2711 RepID=A0ACB8JTG9_CITSI|nr:PHD-type domain-containing protein [Citrus sinensis]